MNMTRELLDEDGENRAVRTFLMLYGGAENVTVGAMRNHMNRSGWRDMVPSSAILAHPDTHLTKAGAQIWIRHLVSLEPKVCPLCGEPHTLDHCPRWRVPAGYRLMSVELAPAVKDALVETGKCFSPDHVWAAVIAAHDLVNSRPAVSAGMLGAKP